MSASARPLWPLLAAWGCSALLFACVPVPSGSAGGQRSLREAQTPELSGFAGEPAFEGRWQTARPLEVLLPPQDFPVDGAYFPPLDFDYTAGAYLPPPGACLSLAGAPAALTVKVRFEPGGAALAILTNLERWFEANRGPLEAFFAPLPGGLPPDRAVFSAYGRFLAVLPGPVAVMTGSAPPPVFTVFLEEPLPEGFSLEADASGGLHLSLDAAALFRLYNLYLPPESPGPLSLTLRRVPPLTLPD